MINNIQKLTRIEIAIPKTQNPKMASSFLAQDLIFSTLQARTPLESPVPIFQAYHALTRIDGELTWILVFRRVPKGTQIVRCYPM